jgi:hypothetical protein
MASNVRRELRSITLSKGLDRNALIFDPDEVVRLLEAAIEREGGQVAFAKRYGVDRSYLNGLLNRRRVLGPGMEKALGLRKVYLVEE